ncbi:MAG: hypothetical protein ABIH66_12670 [bacterium]
MIKPECHATAIGSMPHEDPAAAVDAALNTIRKIPFWPQLPRAGYLEEMIPQYAEGMPGVECDEESRKIVIASGDALIAAMEKFYEEYMYEMISGARAMEGTPDGEVPDALKPFRISEGHAAGLAEFLARGRKAFSGCVAVKGHTTGPITWGLTATTADGRACHYNEQFRDCMVKALERKARWQICKLKKLHPEVIIFIDEPYLQSIGASFVSLKPDDVVNNLNEVIAGIHAEGAAAGIHCCGNTDWALLAGTKADIINFDAYEYAESLSLYAGEVAAFLERGGVLAWGIVPSSEEVGGEDADSLIAALREAMGLLVKKGIRESRLMEACLITPSCGAGSLEPELAERMLRLTAEVSGILRGAN